MAAEISAAFRNRCEGTYYEPFVGSAAVFLHLRMRSRVRRAVLSDVNGKLIEAHRAVRDDVEAVLVELGRLPQEDWKERYYEVREAFNAGPWRGPAHAARFFWLNRAGYNGLYRENRSGRYNVPCGRYARLKLPDAEHFRSVSRALKGVGLEEAPFEDVIAEAGPKDHVYCDPPYVPLTGTACFTGYSKEPFDHAQQLLLARVARRAAEQGARVVLSNHDLPVVRDELYPRDEGFEVLARPQVSRAISRNGARRNAVGEVIAAIGPLRAVQAA